MEKKQKRNGHNGLEKDCPKKCPDLEMEQIYWPKKGNMQNGANPLAGGVTLAQASLMSRPSIIYRKNVILKERIKSKSNYMW